MRKSPSPLPLPFLRPWPVLCAALVLAVGIVLVHGSYQKTRRDIDEDLKIQAIAVASHINKSHLAGFSFAPSDETDPRFRRLCEQLQSCVVEAGKMLDIGAGQAEFTIAGVNGDVLVRGPSSRWIAAPDEARPGEFFGMSDPVVVEKLKLGEVYIGRPEKTPEGTFVRAYAPIFDIGVGKVSYAIELKVPSGGWGRKTAFRITPIVFFVIALLLGGIGGVFLLDRRGRLPESKVGWMSRHCEALTTVIIGLVLTFMTAHFVRNGELRKRHEAFIHLAESNTDGVTRILVDIRDKQLEGLARFFEGSELVTQAEFREYAKFMSLNSALKVMIWAPYTPGDEKRRFEQAQREMLADPDFMIWRLDENGERVRVGGDTDSYPICYMSSQSMREDFAGYDLGSIPALAEAMRKAQETGLVAASDPIVLGCSKNEEKCVMVFRPVFGDAGQLDLKGFTIVIIDSLKTMNLAVDHKRSDTEAILQIGLRQVKPDGGTINIIPLPTDSAGASPPDKPSGGPLDLFFASPVFAFGNTYLVSVAPGPHFFTLYSMWAEGVAVAIGTVVTLLLAFMIGSLINRREKLEHEVQARTRQLRDSEAMQRMLMDSVNVGIAIVDKESGVVEKINPAAESMIGEVSANIVGRVGRELLVPVGENNRGEDGAQEATDCMLVRADGVSIPVLTTECDICVDGVDKKLVSCIDISEKFRARETIKTLNESLQRRLLAMTQPVEAVEGLSMLDLFDVEEIQKIQDAFAKATGVAAIITDIDGKPITKPSNFCYLCEHIIRKTEKGLVNCMHSDAILGRKHEGGPIVQHCLSGGLWDAGASILAGDKHIANWLIGQILDEPVSEAKMLAYADEIGADKEAFKEALGKIERMPHSHFVDISNFLYLNATMLSRMAVQNLMQARQINERKRAEKALADEVMRRKIIFEKAMDGIFILGDGWKVIEANQRFAEMLGYTLDEVFNQHPWDWDIRFDSREEFIEYWGSSPGVESFFETQHRCKDGSIDDVEVSSKPFEWRGETQVLCICRDVSDRKRNEEERDKLRNQLMQSQKMESIGRLAGGVAHDFNNMLQAILGYTEMGIELCGDNEELESHLHEINKAAQRSADLTRQLLGFARKQIVIPIRLDLNDVVTGIVTMLRRLIGEDIQLIWSPGVELWPIKMDPSQLDQVLTNLAVNARDAIDGTGKIVIETSSTEFDEKYCEDHPGFSLGQYAVLSVSDDGCGMDEKTLSGIFEPFFTTKEIGAGTGLGLATVYGIVRQNDGFISVYSEPGQGTTFRIYLPHDLSKDDWAEYENQEECETREELLGGAETILLVEDEEALLLLGRRTLEQLGYNVIMAGTPAEALTLATQSTEHIDLLITDVIMPGMSGRELYEKLGDVLPNFRCLYMSGYTADVIAHHGVLDKGVDFIQKPFSMEGLARKIREVLERKD